jgi:hypothetical protein
MLCTSEALTAVVMMISVFWGTKPCITLTQPATERHVRKRHSSFKTNLFRIVALCHVHTVFQSGFPC